MNEKNDRRPQDQERNTQQPQPAQQNRQAEGGHQNTTRDPDQRDRGSVSEGVDTGDIQPGNTNNAST